MWDSINSMVIFPGEYFWNTPEPLRHTAAPHFQLYRSWTAARPSWKVHRADSFYSTFISFGWNLFPFSITCNNPSSGSNSMNTYSKFSGSAFLSPPFFRLVVIIFLWVLLITEPESFWWLEERFDGQWEVGESMGLHQKHIDTSVLYFGEVVWSFDEERHHVSPELFLVVWVVVVIVRVGLGDAFAQNFLEFLYVEEIDFGKSSDGKGVAPWDDLEVTISYFA